MLHADVDPAPLCPVDPAVARPLPTVRTGGGTVLAAEIATNVTLGRQGHVLDRRGLRARSRSCPT